MTAAVQYLDDVALTCARRVFKEARWVPEAGGWSALTIRPPRLLLTDKLIVSFHVELATWALIPCVGCGTITADASRVITEVLDTLNKGNP